MTDEGRGTVYNRKPVNPEAIALGKQNRAAIVEAVGKFWDEHGRGPTRMEIALAVGLSYKSTKAHVATLMAEGRLVEAAHRLDIPPK